METKEKVEMETRKEKVIEVVSIKDIPEIRDLTDPDIGEYEEVENERTIAKRLKLEQIKAARIENSRIFRAELKYAESRGIPARIRSHPRPRPREVLPKVTMYESQPFTDKPVIAYELIG